MAVKFLFVLICVMASWLQPALARDIAPAKHKALPTLRINGHAMQVEVARTPSQRATGLMNRQHLAPNTGMLFAFDPPQIVSMWMKNTLLPLSVAFIDEHGKIINIADMQPQSLDTHSSLSPAKYALEMNLRWFEKYKIQAGASVAGIDKALAEKPKSLHNMKPLPDLP